MSFKPLSKLISYFIKLPNDRGFTLIELLIAAFIIGTTLTGIFGLFVLNLRTVQEGERRIMAVALANERMEMVRNLPYAEVGTEGGVPSGSIPQEEQVERGGVTYTVYTDIRYVDDYFDGQAAGSSEGEETVTICHKPGTSSERTLQVPDSALDAHLAHGDVTGACGEGGEGTPPGDEYNADYKQVRVEVTWQQPNKTGSVLLVTYVAPPGMEGGEEGGTLDFQALNAAAEGVEGADVRLVNETVDPPIDINTQTNSEGRLVLPGLPESSDSYELAVSTPGYTSEQTYDTTVDFVPDADHAHLSIIIGEVTSKTFAIDSLAGLSITTREEDGTPVSLDYNLRGTKTIGVDGEGDNVYVLDHDGSTDDAGQAGYDDLVWDQYDFTIPGAATGYDIKETSFVLPLNVNPGDNLDMTVTLVPYTPYSLHVTVVDPEGQPVDNATVRLVGQGIDEELGTGAVGQVLFSDLPSGGDYELTVSAPGFEEGQQTVTVSEGSTRARIEMTLQQ